MHKKLMKGAHSVYVVTMLLESNKRSIHGQRPRYLDVAERHQVHALPTHYVIDPQGNLVNEYVGGTLATLYVCSSGFGSQGARQSQRSSALTTRLADIYSILYRGTQHSPISFVHGRCTRNRGDESRPRSPKCAWTKDKALYEPTRLVRWPCVAH